MASSSQDEATQVVGQAKVKKPLWRRMIKWLLVTLAVLLVLVLIVVGLVHTGPGKDFVRGTIEDRLASRFDGIVTLGEVDYAIFGDVELKQLSIKDKGGKSVVDLENLLVSLEWGSLLSGPPVIEKLGITGLALDLVRYEDGTSNLARMRKGPPLKLDGDGITISDIDISKVRVRIENPDGSSRTLEDVTVAGSATYDKAARTAAVDIKTLAAKVTLDVPGRLNLVVPLSTGLTVTMDGDTIAAKLAPIRTTAVLTRPGKPAMEVPLAIGGLEAKKLPELIQLALTGVEAGPLKLTGLSADARLDKDGKPVGEQAFRLQGLQISGAGANTLLGREVLHGDISADIDVTGPPSHLDIVGNVTTTGGVLTLSGNANVTNLQEPAYDIKLVGADINSRKLLVGDKYPDVKTGLTITAKGEGIKPGASRLDVTVEVDKTEFNGRVLDGISLAAKTRGDIITLDNLEVSAFGQTLGLTGQMDREKRIVDARIKTKAGLAAAIKRARDSGVMLPPLPPVDGNLDVDISINALLKPAGVNAVAAAGPGPIQLQKLPVENATIKGYVRADKLLAMGRSVGLLDLAMDVGIKGQHPSGDVTLKVRDVQNGARHFDTIDVALELNGLGQKITASVRDAGQKLALDTVATALVDLDRRRVSATIDSLEIQRGSFNTALVEPITLVIDQPSPDGRAQTFSLPRTQLAMAGGSLVLGGRATFGRDPANPGAQKLEAMQGNVEMRGLSIGRLASMARRSTRGLGGTISGSLSVDGTPSDPEIGFDFLVRARARGAKQALIKASGGIVDKRLRAEVKITDTQTKGLLAQLKLKAPVAFKPKPGLAPGGKLDLTLDVPKRRLDAFGALMPKGLPPGTDPAATLTAHARMVGSTSRPKGDFGLNIEGGLLRARGMSHMPQHQRFALSGELRPEAGKIVLDAALRGWLDADADKLLDLALSGRFDRSPLLRSGMKRPWELNGRLSPVDLARVPRKPGEPPLSGMVDASVALRGNATDLLGAIAVGADGVTTREGAPPINATTNIAIGDRATAVDIDVMVGGLSALTVDGSIGVPGRGLRRLLKKRQQLRASPLNLVATVPKKSLEAWSALRPALAKLPGDVGGRFDVAGTIAVPTVNGALVYDGFQTLANGAGRVAIEANVDADTIKAGLAVGQKAAGRDTAPVSMMLELGRAQLANPEGDLVASFKARAQGVDLLTIVPGFAMGKETLDVAGVLDWNMDGDFRVARGADEERQGLQPGSTLLGDFILRDGRLAVPGTGRAFEDLLIKLTSTADALEIKSVHAREGDVQKQQRTLDMDGKLDWELFKPKQAVLNIKTLDWLVLGVGFDGPEGELDLDMTVTAKALTAPVKDIDVHIKAVDLYAPERFVRAHHQQILAHNDVFFLDESHLPSGKLPTAANKPDAQSAAATPDPDDGRLASAAASDPEAPPGGMDIHLRIPTPIKVLMFPLDIVLQGGLEIEMRGKDLNLAGQLDVLEGTIGVMGQVWDLENGVVTATGGLDTLGARLRFSRYPHHTTLRDVSLRSGNEGKVFIVVKFDVANGLTTDFGGAGGASLLDAATTQNTGRPIYWGRTDLPPSENVQFGPPGQGLVNTFLQTNLRNLIFMDRANGWSDPVDNRAAYGKITNFRAQRFINDDSARITFFAQPPAIGKNVIELQYDWIFVSGPRTVVGTGPRLGENLRLGWGFTVEYASED